MTDFFNRIGQKRASRLSAIQKDCGLKVKPVQQCGTIRNTKKLINRGDFLGGVVELKSALFDVVP